MRPRRRIVWKLSLVFIAFLLSVIVATAHVNRRADAHHLQTALLGLAAVLLTVAFVRILGKRCLDRPIRKLTEGMNRLGEGDFGYRFEVRGDDEFGTLAESFNVMARKLESTVTETIYTRNYFEGIVENSADIIVTVNPQGYIYTFNHGAEQALGYSRDEMIGRRVETLFSDPAERAAAIERLKDVESVVNYETGLLTKDGQVRDVMLTLSHLREPDGTPIGTFGIAKDVTEAKRTQKDLANAEQFAAIGQAVAGLLHALKNMLNAMKGGAYMVKLGLKKDDRALFEEGWGMVQEGITSLTETSRHMLSYVKEWKPELEQVDVCGMVRDIEGLFRPTAAEKGVALRIEIPDDAPLVHCDASLVHTAVMDILSNALDACQERSYTEDETPEISIRAYPTETDSRFVLAVRDNGCGMSPEVQANVFAPFFSTKKKWGTGLGLALTGRTIRTHGGEIEVESEVNVGSEFRIIIPISGPQRDKEA